MNQQPTISVKAPIAEATGIAPEGATCLPASSAPTNLDDLPKLHERQEIVDPLPCSFPQMDNRRWVEIARRHANAESFRQLAKAYGVSHESVRQMLKRVT